MRSLLPRGLVVALVWSAAAALPLPASAQAGAERLQVERDLAAEGVRRGPRHPHIVALRARLAQLPPAVASEALCAALRATGQRLTAERVELSARYGPRHPRMQALRARVTSLAAQRARLCSG